MTTPLDIELQEVARALVDEFGKGRDGSVIWRDVKRVAYDHTTGLQPPSISTDREVKIAPPFPVEQRYVNGDTVFATDSQFFIDKRSITAFSDPKNSDKFVIDDIEHEVVEVHPVYSGDLKAGFDIIIREGSGDLGGNQR